MSIIRLDRLIHDLHSKGSFKRIELEFYIYLLPIPS